MKAGTAFQRQCREDECVVCLAELSPSRPRISRRLFGYGQIFVFCSAECREIFEEDPIPFIRHLRPLRLTPVPSPEESCGPEEQAAKEKYMPHKTKYEFSVQAPQAHSVAVAGTFNGWNPSASPMHRETGGAWRATIALAPGRHEYRFVIDGHWFSDPAAQTVPNEFGETNSVVVVPVPPTQRITPARRWWHPWETKPGKQASDASLLHAAKNKIFGVLTPRTEFPSPRITDRKGRGWAR
jgi:hypothetical protein